MSPHEANDVNKLVAAATYRQIPLEYGNLPKPGGGVLYHIYPVSERRIDNFEAACLVLSKEDSDRLAALLTFLANSPDDGVWARQRQDALYAFWVMRHPLVTALIKER